MLHKHINNIIPAKFSDQIYESAWNASQDEVPEGLLGYSIPHVLFSNHI